MKSKRSNEGYLLIDHSNSPGIGPEVVQAIGDDLPRQAGTSHFETATYRCNHCQFVVVLNPLRQRERGYCANCDHYICDACKALRVMTGICRTWNQVIDDAAETDIKETLIKEI